MFRVIDGKDTGKTKKLLTECAKNNGVYICNHPQGIPEKCIAYGIPIVEAYGYNDILKIDGRRPIYIDELELFAKACFSELAGYSLSIE